MVPLLRLPRRESWWMDAEILMLRHQLLAIPVRAAAGPFAAGYKAMDSRESLKVLPRP